MELTEATIAALAPNAAAVSNAKKISQKGGFVKLCRSDDGTFYLGECKGSGKSPYVVSVDFVNAAEPVFRCSCPSHQFPCKHGLALLYEILEGKPFEPCEIPQDILDKRQKKEARADKQKEKRAAPPKVNKAARAKKLRKQLEGLDLTERMVDELLDAGLGTLGGSQVKTYRDLAKQLGDYYLPGPQTYIQRLILEIESAQRGERGGHERRAVEVLVRLNALCKKARVYLQEKLDSGSVEDDDSALYEELGGVWQLERLQQLGLQKENARLAQLAFTVYLDQARKEYVDLGYWVDVDSGQVSCTYNYRPVKALKYVKQEDSVFELVETPLLTYYPGDLNRRVRWEGARLSPLEAGHLAAIRDKAHGDLATLVKAVKNQIKNTLADNRAALTLSFAQIGRAEGGYALADRGGDTILLRDIPGEEGTVDRLALLPDGGLLRDQVVFGAFFYDPGLRRICLQPYSIVTGQAVVRLLY